MIKLICKQCQKEFWNYPSNHRMYCSGECYRISSIGKHLSTEHKEKLHKSLVIAHQKKEWGLKKGIHPIREFYKGFKHSEETKKKISEHSASRGKFEENSYNWKGDNVKYQGLHKWVRSRLGYPKKCRDCGKQGMKVNGKWNVEWANIDHKYRRVLIDFIPLCYRCHRKYDENLKS